MITIIVAPPKTGKTAYMVSELNDACFNLERNILMRKEISRLNANGFNLTIPSHCVSASFDCTFRKIGHSPRKAFFRNPFRLGYSNDEVKTHFLLPYETVGIQEAQEYFDSRKFVDFERWKSGFYEQHAHHKMNIYMDTHRVGLIDPNIRRLAKITEIRHLDFFYAKNGRLDYCRFIVRDFDNDTIYDKYLMSGNVDKGCYVEREKIVRTNVQLLYNFCYCDPKFYLGHFNEDFDLVYTSSVGSSKQDYIDFLKVYNDQNPKIVKK